MVLYYVSLLEVQYKLSVMRTSKVGFEVLTAVSVKNHVFWDI
jgi:hypothetical protein